MKHLNLTFEDNEFKQLEKIKKQEKLGWEKFFLQLAGIKREEK